MFSWIGEFQVTKSVFVGSRIDSLGLSGEITCIAAKQQKVRKEKKGKEKRNYKTSQLDKNPEKTH